MKHAVIFAHPKKDSFTAAIAASYRNAAMLHGHDVIVRDLYDMKFNPCLATDEIPGPTGFLPRADIVMERHRLSEVDIFTFVYPLWLNAPPAILKGYMERIFGMGFAYGRKGGGNEPLLTGRKMLSFTSSGAPIDWVKKTGAWDAVRNLFDEHFAAVCGFKIVDHVHFGSIVPGIRQDVVERHCQTVRDTVSAHF